MPSYSTIIKECDFCKIKKTEQIRLYKCGRCLSVYYCSLECQKHKYKEHKPYCVGLNSFMP